MKNLHQYRKDISLGNNGRYSNDLIFNKNLFGEPFQLLCWLLNNKPDFEIFSQTAIASILGVKLKTIERAVKVLKKEGYLYIESISQGRGKEFIHVYHVCETGNINDVMVKVKKNKSERSVPMTTEPNQEPPIQQEPSPQPAQETPPQPAPQAPPTAQVPETKSATVVQSGNINEEFNRCFQRINVHGLNTAKTKIERRAKEMFAKRYKHTQSVHTCAQEIYDDIAESIIQAEANMFKPKMYKR